MRKIKQMVVNSQARIEREQILSACVFCFSMSPPPTESGLRRLLFHVLFIWRMNDCHAGNLIINHFFRKMKIIQSFIMYENNQISAPFLHCSRKIQLNRNRTEWFWRVWTFMPHRSPSVQNRQMLFQHTNKLVFPHTFSFPFTQVI